MLRRPLASRIRAGVLGLVALLLAGAGACDPSTRWAAPTSGEVPNKPKPSTATTALTWHPCPEVAKEFVRRPPSEMSYECATLRVPRDWAHPDDQQTFDLALLRAHSSRVRDRIGSLVVNPGGPGAPGIGTAVYLSAALPTEVLHRFDIVGFDPRGTGQSEPLRCIDDSDLDTSFGADPDPVSQHDFDAMVALTRRIVQGCQAKYGNSLRLYSTVQTAHDMDAIRAAIGDNKLTYLGYSYGTVIGSTYAQLFPKNVRALVLDGAVDPREDAVTAAQGQAAGFERAFDQFAAWCRARVNCPIADDPRQAVMSAIDAARTDPVRAPSGRLASAGWVLLGVVEAMYSDAEWPRLAQAIDDLAHRDAGAIFRLADDYATRDASGHYSTMFDANLIINCVDGSGGVTVARARSLQTQWRTQYPMFGASMAVGLVSCAVWPDDRDPIPVGTAAGAPPIVVVGTTNDPATPYEQTKGLADMLGVGQVLTWQGQGHTAYPQTNCVNTAVDRYLIDLRPPKPNLTCPPA